MKKLLLPIACTAVGVYDLLFGVTAFGFAIGWLPFSWGMVSLLAIGGWKAARRIDPKRGTILGSAALLAVWWWRNRPKQRAALQARISLLERSIWPERYGPREGVPPSSNYTQLLKAQKPMLRQAMVEREIVRARMREQGRASYEKRMIAKQKRPTLAAFVADLPPVRCFCGGLARVTMEQNYADLDGFLLVALCPGCHRRVAEKVLGFMLRPGPDRTDSAVAMMAKAYWKRLASEMGKPDKGAFERMLEQQRLYQGQIGAIQALAFCKHGAPPGKCPYCWK